MTDPSPAPQSVPGHWAGFLSDLESIATALTDHISELEGDAKTRADGALSFLQSRLQDARNWIDHFHGLPVVGAPAQNQPTNLTPESPAQQVQEAPGSLTTASDVEDKPVERGNAGASRASRR